MRDLILIFMGVCLGLIGYILVEWYLYLKDQPNKLKDFWTFFFKPDDDNNDNRFS